MKELRKNQRVRLTMKTGAMICGTVLHYSSDRVYIFVDEKFDEISKQFNELENLIVDVKTILGVKSMLSCVISKPNEDRIMLIENNETQNDVVVQKRQFVRINYKFDIQITKMFKKFNAQCMNISAGGICFYCLEDFQVGAKINVELPYDLFDKDLKVSANIIRSRGNLYFCQFNSMNPNDESVILGFIFKKISEN